MLAKDIHVTCVVLTWLLFFVRGIWMLRDSPLLQKKLTRRVPPLVDTLLLASAIVQAMTLHQYPITHAWLTAKLIALLFYIGLGMVALTYGRTKRIRTTAWVGAQLCFFYVVSVALTRNPAVFL
jgi:uncharacterized membrane protein SirB2